MEIKVKQLTGANKDFCEDSVYVVNDSDDFFFAGIADGQSKKKRCIEGGKAALMAVANYLEQKNLSNLFHVCQDEVQYELIHGIREKIYIFSEIYKADPTEFSSTLCCIAGNPQTRDFVLVHLGDGYMIGVTQEEELRIISYPENGITRGHTYLTMSSNALSHIRLHYGNMREYQNIYLLSDGADCVCKHGLINYRVKEPLIKGDFASASAFLEKSGHRDDASMIMVSNEF